MKVEAQKLQVKSEVASRMLLYSEFRFNLIRTTITFFVLFKLKSHFQLSHTHSIVTIKLQSITSRASDWPITTHHMRKKTFKNRTRSICES